MKILILTITALFLSSCAGLSTKVRNEEQIKSIKKIAVIGFQAKLPASREIGLNLGSGKLEGDSGGSLLSQNHAMADQMLVDFTQALTKQRWNVMDLGKMKTNDGYVDAYKKTMTGWQSKPANMEAGKNNYQVKDVMDTYAPQILGLKGRDELMTKLGVDAIATLSVWGYYDSVTVMGIGNRYPRAKTYIQIFKKGDDNIVWLETFEGEKSPQSVGLTGFVDSEKVIKMMATSAKTSYDNMK